MINFFKQWIADTFGFSKSEANGTMMLIYLIISLAIFPRIFLSILSQGSESIHTDNKSLNEWGESLNERGKELEKFIQSNKEIAIPTEEKTSTPLHTFHFDPNTATHSEFLALGLGEYASKNIINYRSAGGSFKIKKDLLKIYSIPQERVKELWSYIKLPEELEKPKISEKEKTTPSAASKEPEKPILININSANSEELQEIHGIGPTYAKRIIEYRDKLGGFVDSNQLYEVWGLEEQSVKSLLDHVTFSAPIRQIDLNTDSLKHLFIHPYIDYSTAKAILNFRKQRGNLDSISQLKRIKIIDDSLYQKIYPYLSLNP